MMLIVKVLKGKSWGGRVSPNLFIDKGHVAAIKNKIYVSKNKNMKDSLEETYNMK